MNMKLTYWRTILFLFCFTVALNCAWIFMLIMIGVIPNHDWIIMLWFIVWYFSSIGAGMNADVLAINREKIAEYE